MENETKKWWQSKGVWGGVIAGLAALGGILGWNIGTEDANALTDHVMEIIGIVGALLAMWGRWTAKKEIA